MKLLGLIVLVGLLVVAGGVVPWAVARGAPASAADPAQEGMSVVGEGVVLASPNLARVMLGVEVSDASLAAAQSEAARRMDAVIQKLRAAGIPDSDIRTVGFNVNPQYDQSGGLRAYQVQNLVEVKTKDLPGLGALLDSTVGAGATRISSIRFDTDDMPALKAQARDQAMQNARAKAEQLARDAGVSLGRTMLVEELEAGDAQPVRAGPAVAAAPAVTTPIQPGELQVRTVVHVVWAIQ